MSLLETTERIRMRDGLPGILPGSAALDNMRREQEELHNLIQLKIKDEQLYNTLYPKQAYEINWDISADPTYGQSKYDKAAMSVLQFQDLNDLRANQQSGFTKAAAGAGKALLKTGTMTLNLLGQAVSAIEATFTKGKFSEEGSGWMLQDKDRRGWNRLQLSKTDNTWVNRWNTINNSSSIQKFVDDADDWMERAMPNYRTYHEQSMPWESKILPIPGSGWTDFWFDDILKNIGFSWGSMIGAKGIVGTASRILGNGRAVSAATARSLGKGLTDTERAIRRTSNRKLYQKLGMQGSVDDITKILRENGNLTKQAEDILAELRLREKANNIFNQVTGSIIGAAGEAQYEAHATQQEFIDEQMGLYDKWFEKNEGYLRDMYDKRRREDTQYDGTFEDFKNEVYNNDMNEIVRQSYYAAHGVFGWEFPILMASNFVTFRRFFNGGWNSHNIGRGVFGNGGKGSVFDDAFIKNKIKIIKDPATKKITSVQVGSFNIDKIKAVKGLFTEGAEEMAQRAVTSYMKAEGANDMNSYFGKYCSTIYNPNYIKEGKESISAFRYAMRNTFLENEGWMEGFAGIVMGAFGAPSVHRNNSKELGDNTKDSEKKTGFKIPFTNKRIRLPYSLDWDTGFANEFKMVHNTEKLVKDAAAKINTYISNDVERERFEQLVVKSAINRQLSDAVHAADRLAFKDAELDELLTTIYSFDLIGAREVLNELVESAKNTMPEHVSNWLNDRDGENRTLLKEEDKNIKAEDFLERIRKEYEQVRKVIDGYTEHRKAVDGFLCDRVDDKHKHFIAMLAVKAQDKIDRIREQIKTLKESSNEFDNIPDPISSKDFGNVITALDRDLGGPYNYKKNKKMPSWGLQEIIDNYYEILNKERGQISDEQRKTEIAAELSDFLKKFMIDNKVENISAIDMDNILDIIANMADHSSLMNEYKRYLIDPEAMERIENTIKQIAETEENEAQETPGNIPEGFDIDNLDEMIAKSHSTSTSGVYASGETETMAELFLSEIDSDSIPDGMKDVKAMVGELENPDGKNLDDIIKRLGERLEEITRTYGPDTAIFKTAAGMLEDLDFSYRQSRIPERPCSETNRIVREAMGKIRTTIDGNNGYEERKSGWFDEARGVFTNRLVETDYNGQKFTIEIIQDPVKNETYILASYGSSSVRYSLAHSFNPDFNAIIWIKQTIKNAVTVNGIKLRDEIKEALAKVCPKDSIPGLHNVIDDSFMENGDITMIKKNTIIRLETGEDVVNPRDNMPFTSALSDNAGDKKTDADILEIVDNMRREILELQEGMVTEPQAPPPATEEGGQGGTPAAEGGTTEQPEAESGGQPVNEPSEEGSNTPETEGQPENTPEDGNGVQPQTEGGEESAQTPVEDTTPAEETIPDEEKPLKDEDVEKNSDEISKKPVAGSKPPMFFLLGFFGRIPTQQEIDDAENEYVKNSDSLIPFTQWDTLNIRERFANKTVKSQYYRRALELSAESGYDYAKMGVAVVNWCIDNGLYDYLDRNSLPTSTQLKFRVPTMFNNSDIADYIRQNLIEATAVIDGEERTIGFVTSKSSNFSTIVSGGINPKTGYYSVTGLSGAPYSRGTVVKSDTSDKGKTAELNELILKHLDNRKGYFIFYTTKDKTHFFNEAKYDNELIRQWSEYLPKAVMKSGRMFEPGKIYTVTSQYGNIADTLNVNSCEWSKSQPVEWSRTADSEELNAFTEKVFAGIKSHADYMHGDKHLDAFNATIIPLNKALRDNFAFYIDEERHDTGSFKITKNDAGYFMRIEPTVKKNEGEEGESDYLTYKDNDGKKHVQLKLADNFGKPVISSDELIDFIFGRDTNAAKAAGIVRSIPIHSVTAAVLNGNGTRLDGREDLGFEELVRKGLVRMFMDVEAYNISPTYSLDKTIQKRKGFVSPEKFVEKNPVQAQEETPAAQTPVETEEQQPEPEAQENGNQPQVEQKRQSTEPEPTVVVPEFTDEENKFIKSLSEKLEIAISLEKLPQLKQKEKKQLSDEEIKKYEKIRERQSTEPNPEKTCKQ